MAFLIPERVPPGSLCQPVTEEGEWRVPGNNATASVKLRNRAQKESSRHPETDSQAQTAVRGRVGLDALTARAAVMPYGAAGNRLPKRLSSTETRRTGITKERN